VQVLTESGIGDRTKNQLDELGHLTNCRWIMLRAPARSPRAKRRSREKAIAVEID